MRNRIANFAAKSSKFLIEKLHLGSGSALPGRVALAIEPHFISEYNSAFKDGDYGFFVSGTNGKTTTSGILASIVKAATNKEPVNNALGANLYYGIASELANNSNFSQKLSSEDFVFELDEAAFRLVAKDLKPKAVVLTNIFRDQLDRFGEINTTQNLILEGLQAINKKGIKVFLNAGDQKIAEFKDLLDDNFESIFYRVDNIEIAGKEGSKIQAQNDKDIFTASLLERQVTGSLISLKFKKDKLEVFLPIAGDFNIYNACAAAAAAYHSGISMADIKTGIETYTSAFGRGEKVIYKERELNLFLIKNPAGCTEVINFVAQFPGSKILIAINDDYADGRDVSWLWDAGFEEFATKDFDFVCTGSRAYDMALRLKYAGIPEEKIVIDEAIIDSIKKLALNSKKDENIFVLPTYTSLLKINSVMSS